MVLDGVVNDAMGSRLCDASPRYDEPSRIVEPIASLTPSSSTTAQIAGLERALCIMDLQGFVHLFLQLHHGHCASYKTR